ncbi:Crp/Fnr family transcriptional regulator [Rhizobium sp. LjRoot254]|uniref:Crp/Fnr family transcriptional regulator n=1 Tax=Rhizobium sp. LjRoot254 TaxID=3342297 RepID=UPI003ECDCA21
MSSKLFTNLPRAVRVFAPGAVVFHRGDPVERLYVVRSGTIRLLRHQEDGHPVVLQRASRGDILAEASVVSAHYHCDAIALTEAVTEAFAVPDIRRLLDTDIGFCRAWAASMSNQLQVARRRAELMSLRTVSERLDFWLVWNEVGMPKKGSWKDAAEEMGVSPEALYREISARGRRASNPRQRT